MQLLLFGEIYVLELKYPVVFNKKKPWSPDHLEAAVIRINEQLFTLCTFPS